MAKTVLLIDDDVDLLRQMATALAGSGYRVHVATDGASGLEQFKSVSPDLVVTDIIMPTREGIETIMGIKRERPDARVLAISGGYRVGPDDFLTLARHIGADDVLPKPFRLAQLVAAAARLLHAGPHVSAA